jgi:MFS family permease
MPAPHRRDLPLLAGAVCLSSLGDLLAIVALALHVHEITGSALAVSALFATTMLPAVALAPLAGRLADRVESVRLLALASALQAVVALALAFTTSLLPLLALALLLAAGATLTAPAEFALVPAIARKGRLVAANGGRRGGPLGRHGARAGPRRHRGRGRRKRPGGAG